jgi:hypothetical protein
MKNTTVHNIDLSYDGAHERVADFVEHFKQESRKDEFRAYCKLAKENDNYKMHLSDKNGDEFTLEYKGDDQYNLRLRDLS